MSASTVAVYLGFCLMASGVYLQFGVGWACLGAGLLLFVAGNLKERR